MSKRANQSELFSFDFTGKHSCKDNRFTPNTRWFAEPTVMHYNFWRFSVFRRGFPAIILIIRCRSIPGTIGAGPSRLSGILVKQFINIKY